MKKRITLAIWLVFLLCSGFILGKRTQITTDLSFFLPRAADHFSNLVINISREGPGSRLILGEITGGSLDERIRISDQMIDQLGKDQRFTNARNGLQTKDLFDIEHVLFPYRFHLISSASDHAWDAPQLHEALMQRFDELSGVKGQLLERWIERDPLGYWTQFLKRLEHLPSPAVLKGHWIRNQGEATLFILETGARSFELEAQASAQQVVNDLFKRIRGQDMHLTLGGAGVLAVDANRSVSREAGWLSLINTLIVSALLIGVYRSFKIYILGMIPLLNGLIFGAMAIRLAFGEIHAITLGFGSTLLGVAADYPNHFFTHLKRNQRAEDTMQHLWPTLRMGILTNVAGFGVMMFSGFRGLQEIGIFAASGLVAAGLSTRFILPVLTPENAHVNLPPFKTALKRFPRPSRALRILFCVILTACTGGWFLTSQTPLFNDDLGSLNPVPADRLMKDINLQQAFSIPDMRYLALIVGHSAEEVLQKCEQLRPSLTSLSQKDALEGFQLLCDITPSQKRQKERLSTLPSADQARTSMKRAVLDTPFDVKGFSPLLEDLSHIGELAPLTEQTLRNTALEAGAHAMHQASGDLHTLIVPFHDVKDAAALKNTLLPLAGQDIHFLDLRSSLTERIRAQRIEAARLMLWAIIFIYGFLAIGLRSAMKAWSILLPMLLATLSTAWVMAVFFKGLTIYHLASLLLVMGLSLDQALFFNRPCENAEEARRTRLSILICSSSSICAFGGLAFSSIQLLTSIGATVALGAFLAVCYSSMLAKHSLDSR